MAQCECLCQTPSCRRERSHRFLHSETQLCAGLTTTWAMCGHCFVRKISFKCGLWWFRRAGRLWSVLGTVIRGPGQYAAVSCLKSHLHFLWQSSTGHILSPDSVTSTENHFENWNRTSPWPLLIQSQNIMIKQERKCSGERERAKTSNPVLFRHHGEFAQKSVSLVFINMIQEPSATVVGLHLHLRTLAQKTNTSLELLALPLHCLEQMIFCA